MKFILQIIVLAMIVTSCGSSFIKPVPSKLDDSSYKKPQFLGAKEEHPDGVTSHVDKQVKFVTPGGNKKKSAVKSDSKPVVNTAVSSVSSLVEQKKEEVVAQVEESPIENPSYVDAEEAIDPVHKEAAIVAVSKDNQHPSRTSYNPFDRDGKLIVNLKTEAENFVYPINGKYSSGYGARGRGWHSGVDLTAPYGTPIYAAFDGRVRISKPYGGYGNMVVIQHANGLETLYGHCSENLVQEGQSVKAGDKIALCGRTGRATANHLHFEVRIAGSTINPALLVDYSTKSIQSGILTVSKSGSRITASRFQGGSKIENDQKPKVPTKQEAVLASTSSQSSGSTQAAATLPKSSGSTVASAGKSYHTIAKGDTLYSLAKRYGTTVDNICTLNQISKTIILKIGAKLRMN